MTISEAKITRKEARKRKLNKSRTKQGISDFKRSGGKGATHAHHALREHIPAAAAHTAKGSKQHKEAEEEENKVLTSEANLSREFSVGYALEFPTLNQIADFNPRFFSTCQFYSVLLRVSGTNWL